VYLCAVISSATKRLDIQFANRLPMSRPRKVILVTGSPRSGTTPCGSNLALAPGVRYLFEPFNPNYGIRGISRFYEVPGANDFSMERFDECVRSSGKIR
jgi:hypothetical protein